MILAGGMAPGVGAHYQEISADIVQGHQPRRHGEPAVPGVVDLRQHGATTHRSSGSCTSRWTTRPRRGSSVRTTTGTGTPTCASSTAAGKIGVPFAADQDVTPQECADVHGEFMKKTVWMVHAWVVPGWESPQGVFSHDNLHVYCPGNTDLTERHRLLRPPVLTAGLATARSGARPGECGATVPGRRAPSAACVLVGWAAPAAAHAAVTASSPAQGAHLARVPHTVTVVFDQPVQPDDGGLVVLDSAGQPVQVASATRRRGPCRRPCRPRSARAPTSRTTR